LLRITAVYDWWVRLQFVTHYISLWLVGEVTICYALQPFMVGGSFDSMHVVLRKVIMKKVF